MFFSLLASLVGLLATVYLTRTIDPDQFGVIGIFMAISFVLPQLISFSTINLVSINKVNLSRGDFQGFASLNISFSITIFVIILIFSAFSSIWFEGYRLIFLLLPLLGLAQYLAMFHNAELVQEGRSTAYGYYRLGNVVLAFILTYVMVQYFSMSWDGRLIAIVFSEVFVLLISAFVSFSTLKRARFSFRFRDYIYYVKFGFPLMLGLLAGWVLNQSDNFILLHFFSLYEVGLYASAYSMGLAINIVNQSVVKAFQPRIYIALRDGKARSLIKSYTILYFFIIMGVSLLFGMCSYYMVPIVFGEKYSGSEGVVFIIAIAFGFNGVYRVGNQVLTYHKKNVLQTKILSISAVQNLILSIFFMPLFGFYGPAVATVFSYATLAFLSFFFGHSTLKQLEASQ
jgi:O-antigen/teichoic acid export membrane protein